MLKSVIPEFCNYPVATALDWVGSLLMMATVWGWVYRRIAPGLEKKYLKTRRHKNAIDRLFIRKLIYILPVYQDLMTYRNLIGIGDETSFVERLSLIYHNHRIHRRLEKYGLLTDEDRNEWTERIDQNRLLNRLAVMFIVNTVYSACQFRLARLLHLTTMSLFTGKVGFFLFFIGFIFWNTGKLFLMVLRINP